MVKVSKNLVSWSPIVIGKGSEWLNLGATVSRSGSVEIRRITVVDPAAAGTVPRRLLCLWAEQ